MCVLSVWWLSRSSIASLASRLRSRCFSSHDLLGILSAGRQRARGRAPPPRTLRRTGSGVRAAQAQASRTQGVRVMSHFGPSSETLRADLRVGSEPPFGAIALQGMPAAFSTILLQAFPPPYL